MKKGVHTISKLHNLVEQRIKDYYPEFTSRKLHLKSRLLKKCHQSRIYQFDVYNADTLLKSIIVKKRVPNRFYGNNIFENTKNEYTILKHFNDLSNPHISVPRALNAMPKKGILITEKVEGESLYSYLKKNSYLPITKAKRIFLKGLFAKVGIWLREFHKAGDTGEKARIDTQEVIAKAEQIVAKFPSMGLSGDLGKAVINRVRRIAEVNDVQSYLFPITFKHGDFQPLNIIYNNDNIAVLDISSLSKDLSIKDVCNFITGLNISRIKLLPPFYKTVNLNETLQEFLQTYYKDEIIPYPTIDFVKTLGSLEQLDNIYGRNQTYIKRKIITSFYDKEIRNLIKN